MVLDRYLIVEYLDPQGEGPSTDIIGSLGLNLGN